jgi:hypothetical protein
MTEEERYSKYLRQQVADALEASKARLEQDREKADLATIYAYIKQYGGEINCIAYTDDWHLVLLDVHREQKYHFKEFRGPSCVKQAAAWLREREASK